MLHRNSDLSVLCSKQYSDNQIKDNEMAWPVACERTQKNGCRILVEKSEEKRTLGIPTHRWEANMKRILNKWDWRA
jgi:hypothetical protein